jgi:hypothetical protein
MHHNAELIRKFYTSFGNRDARGMASWEAWYTFSATGRRVHNKIDAR